MVRAPAVRTGLALMAAHGLTAQVLPELHALRGVEQNVFHHLDVHDHTLEVLDQVAAIERDPVAAASASTPRRSTRCCAAARRRADARRGDALRRAAARRGQAVDAARARRRPRRLPRPRPRGRARRARRAAPPARLRRSSPTTSRALPAPPAARLPRPRAAARPPRRCGATSRRPRPYSAEVTVFTVADRLATRGRNAEPAIAAHLELARELLGPALARRGRPPAPLLRGDELARELGLPPGPASGELLAQLEEDRFAGAIATREDALARARELRAGS